MSEETITVLYNVKYGGWGISQEGIALYNERMSQLSSEYVPVKYDFGIDRHDPVLVQVWKELGDKCSGKYCAIDSVEIYKKYENYYEVNEYDGIESISINILKYKLDKIKEVIENDIGDGDEKIEVIEGILNEH